MLKPLPDSPTPDTRPRRCSQHEFLTERDRVAFLILLPASAKTIKAQGLRFGKGGKALYLARLAYQRRTTVNGWSARAKHKPASSHSAPRSSRCGWVEHRIRFVVRSTC